MPQHRRFSTRTASSGPPGWTAPAAPATAHDGPVPPTAPPPSPRRSRSAETVRAEATLLMAGFVVLFLAGMVSNAGGSWAMSLALLIAALVMLVIAGTVPVLHRGVVGVAWAGSAAFALGVGLAPLRSTTPAAVADALTEAGATTLLVVVGAALHGTLTAADVGERVRTASIATFAAVLVAWLTVCAGAGSIELITVALGGLTGLLIVLVSRATWRPAAGDDPVWLALSTFVAVVMLLATRRGIARR